MHKIKVYYMSFEVESTTVPQSITMLKHLNSFRNLSITDDQYRDLSLMLSKPIVKAKFSEDYLRLAIHMGRDGWYYVDSDGVVLHENRMYYISPGRFLQLSRMMRQIYR